MAPYLNSMYTADYYGGVQGQDGSWDTSVNMQRTDSQSTSCTVESSYTTSSYSALSSATDYSSGEPALFRDDDFLPTSSYPDLYPLGDFENANHVLSATGAQYQQYDYPLFEMPELSGPPPPLNTQAGIEVAAWRATLDANSLVIDPQTFGNYQPVFITFEAVEEAFQRHMEEGMEIRPAVQDVLLSQLRPRFKDMDSFRADISRILEEAAYHLRIRLQGPEVVRICYLAIVAVLDQLLRESTTDTNAVGPEPVDSPDEPAAGPSAGKRKFVCDYPQCGKTVSREADLGRHCKIVHGDDHEKTKFFCDYKKCSRHTTPFYRQDHFRDHLRIYHKEDLVRRGNKGDDEWWATRAPWVLTSGWWRCSRCLIRINLSKHGFVCDRCRNPCEKERQQYRTAMADAGLRRDGSEGTTSRQHHTTHASSSASSGRRHAHSS